jgi:hypothetical protein
MPCLGRFVLGLSDFWAACYKCGSRDGFRERGIRIVVVRDLAKVEARVRFPYPAPINSTA